MHSRDATDVFVTGTLYQTETIRFAKRKKNNNRVGEFVYVYILHMSALFKANTSIHMTWSDEIQKKKVKDHRVCIHLMVHVKRRIKTIMLLY